MRKSGLNEVQLPELDYTLNLVSMLLQQQAGELAPSAFDRIRSKETTHFCALISQASSQTGEKHGARLPHT